MEVVHTIPQEERFPKLMVEKIVALTYYKWQEQDRQGLKTTQHAGNTHVQQVVNTVEVKTLNIIERTRHGEKVDPDDDQPSKDQPGDQAGRDSSDSVLSRGISSEFRKSRTRKD